MLGLTEYRNWYLFSAAINILVGGFNSFMASPYLGAINILAAAFIATAVIGAEAKK